MSEIIQYHIACLNCGKPYPETSTPYRCSCGGLFDYQDSLQFDPKAINLQKPGIWRFASLFGLPGSSPILTLGEGNTPLVWVKKDFNSGDNNYRIGLKCEYQNPTGSFKDRGSPLILSFLIARGARRVVEDSSGNAGASFAAYANMAGLEAKVYAPAAASGIKRKQIEVYGATLIQVPGARSKAAEMVRTEVDSSSTENGWLYASHAYLPFNIPGYATLAFELVEQSQDGIGTVIIPVGQGGLLLGLVRGFEALRNCGLIVKIPFIVGVQAQACAPLWAVLNYGAAGLNMTTEGETIAEGIRVRYPLRGDQIVLLIEKIKGKIFVVSEQEIRVAHRELATRGFLVEYTSAVVWAALDQLPASVPTPIIAILTGSGLKTLPEC